MKFFRKIREKLIIKNKVKNYLLYALGEIALVMVGILLAVYVNNIIQEGKNQKTVNTYLIDLKSDISSDISELRDDIKNNENRVTQIDTILMTLISGKEISKSEKIEFLNRHIPLLNESYFLPERSTINQIESSSHGVLIDKQLRDKIFKYYTAQQQNEMNNERSIQLYMHNFNTPIFLAALNDGDLYKSTVGSSLGMETNGDYRNMLKDKEYLSALMLRRGNCTTQNSGYQRMLKLAEELLNLLDSMSDEK